MARTFTSSTDRFERSDPLFDLQGHAWTFGCWFKPTGDGIQAGASVGELITTGQAGTVENILRVISGNKIAVYKDRGTDMHYQSSTTFASDVWNCVVGTYRSSNGGGRIFLGTETSAMAEVTYQLTTNGAGTSVVGGNVAVLGNTFNGTTVHGFDGAMARAFAITAVEGTLDMAERFRLGYLDFIMREQTGGHRGFLWPLDEQSATDTAFERGHQKEHLDDFGSPGVVDGPNIEVGWDNAAMVLI